jgi:hypothetical protein
MDAQMKSLSDKSAHRAGNSVLPALGVTKIESSRGQFETAKVKVIA